MRTFCSFAIAIGSAVGLTALTSLTLTSQGHAWVQAPATEPGSPDGTAKPQNNIVRVQSRRQKRQINDFLSEYDFRDSNYVDTTPPSLFVEACRKRKKYLMMFTDRGEYFGKRFLGQCQDRARVVPLAQLREWLQDKRYSDVRFTDERSKIRIAEACLDGRRYVIRFDERGKATPRRKWFGSSCPNGNDNRDDGNRDDDDRFNDTGTLSKRSARSTLRDSGYRDIRFDRQFSNSRLAEVCQGIRKFRVHLGSRGDVRARRAVGFCKPDGDDRAPPKPSARDLDADSNTAMSPEKCQQILTWMQHQTPIVFEPASDEVRDESRDLLYTIAESVERCPRTLLRIEGHTDSIGPTRLNRKLSAERAEAVRKFLIRRRVPERRVTAKGYGEEYPIVGNLIEKNRARNRRIELILEWGNVRDLGLPRANSRRDDDDDRG